MCQRGNGLIRNVNLNSTEMRLKAPLQKNGCMRECRNVVREFSEGVSNETEAGELVKGSVKPLPKQVILLGSRQVDLKKKKNPSI